MNPNQTYSPEAMAAQMTRLNINVYPIEGVFTDPCVIQFAIELEQHPQKAGETLAKIVQAAIGDSKIIIDSHVHELRRKGDFSTSEITLIMILVNSQSRPEIIHQQSFVFGINVGLTGLAESIRNTTAELKDVWNVYRRQNGISDKQ